MSTNVQRQVRRYLAEGNVKTYKEGELAAKLVNDGFEEDEALLAAAECQEMEEAVKFLRQECELCTNIMAIKEVRNFTRHCKLNIRL